MRRLRNPGALTIAVFADGELVLNDRCQHLYFGTTSIPLDLHPWGTWIELRLDGVQEHPEIPGWLTGTAEVTVGGGYYRLDRKPFSMYALNSEHYAAILHFPLHRDLGRELQPAGGPGRVLSVAMRASFQEEADAVLSEERAA